MKKTLFYTAAAAALLVASASAIASPASTAPSGTFLDVGVGKARYSLDVRNYNGKSDFAYSLTGGYRWALNDRFALGIEGGYADLGKITHHEGDRLNRGRGKSPYEYAGELKSHAWLIGANAKWQWTPAWSLVGRLGTAYTVTRFEAVTSTAFGERKVRASESRGSMYVGLGLGYAVSSTFDITTGFTHYSLTGYESASRNRGIAVNTFNVGAAFRF